MPDLILKCDFSLGTYEMCAYWCWDGKRHTWIECDTNCTGTNNVQRNIPDSSTVQHKASAALAKPDPVVKDVSNVILKQNLTSVSESKN